MFLTVSLGGICNGIYKNIIWYLHLCVVWFDSFHEAIIEKEKKKTLVVIICNLFCKKWKNFNYVEPLWKFSHRMGKVVFNVFWNNDGICSFTLVKSPLSFPLRSVLIFIYFLQFFLYLFMLNVLYSINWSISIHISHLHLYHFRSS